ncbi:MAG: anhydro-N-acetylmuramic acid kinase [Opitutus sp.]|nr:anhydro-N-acetylmuramic acid kinase [Opitutus sp.]
MGDGKTILVAAAGSTVHFSRVPSLTNHELFIGVLSGTSVDAVDAALVGFGERAELIATHTLPYPPELRAELLALAIPGENEIDRLGAADVSVGRHFAQAVNGLLASAKVSRERVRAIGSHGQTVRHRPRQVVPFTLQVGDPNVIATETGLPVVADFRRKDLALGGQGAPLVPAFHAAMFRREHGQRVVVNIGGIANATVLPAAADAPVRGYDTGPGNTLLDAWCRLHTGAPMDRDGRFAARGTVQERLLRELLADEFFARPAPKSTGPEYFSLAWLQERAAGFAPADVQATLVALTARSIAEAVRGSGAAAALECGRAQGASLPLEVYVCGGGARNPVLMQALRERLPECAVETTAALGVDPGWVEAMAFAWLARQRMNAQPGNCVEVTGAKSAAVLGGLWWPE